MDKKEKKRISGAKARQDGENIKNLIASKLSFIKNTEMSQSDPKLTHSFLNQIGLSLGNVNQINTKALADKRGCNKPDLICNVTTVENNKTSHRISLKSTFQKTQVAVHSVNSFINNLASKKINLNSHSQEFLTHFVKSENSYAIKPDFSYTESIRRQRFSLDEIEKFNPGLFLSFTEEIKKNAEKILRFIVAEGTNTKNSEYANYLMFCNKPLSDLYVVKIDDIVDHFIKQSEINNTWVTKNKLRPNCGITTVSLFHGLLTLQMKGSGKGEAYHHLQFNIAGSFIRKQLLNKELS